ncbi:MAG: hypothetical protein WBS19_15105 [Candidatus Korobacteraceae bacterium]
MARWPVLVPLGQLSVTGGRPLLLSTNCGPLGGQAGTDWKNPPLSGTPFRQITLTNTAGAGAGNLYLLPRGSTFASNPGIVIACILPGQTMPIPYGQPLENGILPENFALDSDSGKSPVAYSWHFELR